MLFNNTGTTLYVMGAIGDDINAYTLSTPYDISTATFSSIALSVGAQETTPFAMLFNNTGTTLYVMGSVGDDINTYTLSTPYTTGTYTKDITNLTPGTTYYVRSFAENSAGVGYSATTESFSTTPEGGLLLENHTEGQVSNAFSFQNKMDEVLFAFQVTASTTNTVTDLQFALSGVTEITTNELINLRLFVDVNNNRQLNIGVDTQVGGAGTLSIDGQQGSIVFTDSFALATSSQFIFVGDTVGIDGGDSLVIRLVPEQIQLTTPSLLSGEVNAVQHVRNNRSAGGRSASIGPAAPEGDGDVGGGQSGGGGDAGAVDTNTGGGLIGSSPNFRIPTAGSGQWAGISNAFDGVDGTYASTQATNNADFSAYQYAIPGTNTIAGIAVKLEVSGTTAAGSIAVALSWDGGTSWTTTKNTPTLTTTDAVVTLGGPSDLWGRTWSVDELSNANFVVRLTGAPSSNTVQVDGVQVRVYSQATGGGSGGGGAI
jgi:hypothetical protein